jgi:hypothetical protein
MKKQRKNYTPEENVAIVRRHLLEKEVGDHPAARRRTTAIAAASSDDTQVREVSLDRLSFRTSRCRERTGFDAPLVSV